MNRLVCGKIMGRTPWSARDALVPPKPARGPAADQGVRPTILRTLHRGGIGVLSIAAAFLWLLPPARTQSPSPDQALINQYCVGCHNQRTKTAGLMLDKLDLTHPGTDAE